MIKNFSSPKQILVALAVGLAIIGVLAFFKVRQISSAKAEAAQRKQPPEAVTSAIANKVSWPLTFSAIGTLHPVQGATLGAEETGRVSSIRFEPGQFVQQGALLVELDTTVEEAQLRGALAQLDLANISSRRARDLRQKNVNSVAELDTAEAGLRNAEAEVSRYKAQIARKRVVAPFSGKTGIRLVNEGQIVMPGTEVVSLQSFDPLYADFSLPQQTISSLKTGVDVELRVDAFPGKVFPGKLTAIQPEVELATRMIKCQATIANSNEELRPGMFVKVSVILPRSTDVLQIPAAGVLYAPYGDSVYIIEQMKDPQGSEYLGVRRQTVKLGENRGDLVEVLSGLEPGSQIVSSGVFKLRPAAPVIINNSVVPGAEIAPRPADT